MGNRRPSSRTKRHDFGHRTGGEPAVGAQPAADRDRQPGPDLPWPDADDVTPAGGFTDFDPPAPAAERGSQPTSPKPARVHRDDFYDTPIVDGKPVPNPPLTRLRDRLRALFLTAGEREEAHLETSLRRLPGVSRTNIVATLSPKGGCGKTTSTFLTGNVLASHLRLRALAVDLNPDFGTLADLAPDRARGLRLARRPAARQGRHLVPRRAPRVCLAAPERPASVGRAARPVGHGADDPELYGEL